jgi:hypothetical protein
LNTSSCLSVPEKASCIPGLQSTCPLPVPLQLDVLIAQLSSTHAKLELPEHEEQPSAFQKRFWSVPF